MRCHAITCILIFSGSALGQVTPNTLFLETFDSSFLPFTLSYEATPGITWTFDAQNQLYADNDGGIDLEGFAAWQNCFSKPNK